MAKAAHQASVTDTKVSAELAVSRIHIQIAVRNQERCRGGVAVAAHQASVTDTKASE